MVYVNRSVNVDDASVLSSAASSDARLAMHDRLPRMLQPFLTWLTAKPAPGEAMASRSPLWFVACASLQVVVGMAMAWLGLKLPALAGVPVAAIGLLVSTSGLGLFQVVVFHHCSHGTVFKSREANIRIGRLISAILVFKHFDAYKREHMLHHNARKLLTDEDEFANFVFDMCQLQAGVAKRELWRRVVSNLISPVFHGRFLMRRMQAAFCSHDRIHNLTGIAVWGGMALAAVALGQTGAFLFAVVLPVTVLLQVATVVRILCEHSFPAHEMMEQRGKDFACHATSGVFPGAQPPRRGLGSLRGVAEWTLWWADMLTVQLFVRMFVMVGDAPCHDFHHRRPSSKRWTSYIQARQSDLEAGSPGFNTDYSETWGLFKAVDQTLASLSRAPLGFRL